MVLRVSYLSYSGDLLTVEVDLIGERLVDMLQVLLGFTVLVKGVMNETEQIEDEQVEKDIFPASSHCDSVPSFHYIVLAIKQLISLFALLGLSCRRSGAVCRSIYTATTETDAFRKRTRLANRLLLRSNLLFRAGL